MIKYNNYNLGRVKKLKRVLQFLNLKPEASVLGLYYVEELKLH